MTLFEQIKADQLRFRKLSVGGSGTAKVYAKLLTTLIGESQIDGKAPTDDQLIAKIQIFIKNIKQSIEIRETEEALLELQLLEAFLPPYITAEQVIEICAAHEDLNKGQIMGLVKAFCKENKILFDGKLVSSLV